MRIHAFGLGFSLATLLIAPAHANAKELGVCVEVLVQRAPEKSGASGSATTSPPAAAPMAVAAGETSSPPAVPEAPALALSPQPAPAAGPRADIALAAQGTASVAPEGERDLQVESGAHLPLGQTPEAYLRRLLEHFVTHERGFVAVKSGCEQRIVVDLYPLRFGWTVFASYTGTGREERVDQLLPTELSQFAERSVVALLRDVPITETVDRNNVLTADSLRSTQSIRGRGHVVIGVGTRLRAGRFHTANDAGSANETELRPFAPVLVTVGYRGQFEAFGVEAAGEVDFGTSQVAAQRNPGGGHVDFGGSTGFSLHAVRYLNVRGLTSLYVGGGATFALHWFSIIKPEAERGSDARSTLWSGGLDVDGVLGYELMRASAISFYLQGEINLPAYAVRNENAAGRVNTWFPGAALKLGTIF